MSHAYTRQYLTALLKLLLIPENFSGGNLGAVAHKVIQKLFCYFDKEKRF